MPHSAGLTFGPFADGTGNEGECSGGSAQDLESSPSGKEFAAVYRPFSVISTSSWQ